MGNHNGRMPTSMKPRLILGLGLACLLLVVALATSFFLAGPSVPSTTCRPITYPDGAMTTQSHTIYTTESLESVFQFYDQHLKPTTPTRARMNEWSREHLNPPRGLDACQRVDADGVTTETGCISVSAEGAATKIEISYRHSEGGSASCREAGES
jgi:hypothetical protein